MAIRISATDVEQRGYMDYVVRRAIALGLTPMQALQAVTLNPATYSGLERDIGGIAPGRFADLVLIDDLEQCRVREVFVAGKVVARGGESTVKPDALELPREMLYSLRVNNADNICNVQSQKLHRRAEHSHHGTCQSNHYCRANRSS